MLNIIFCWTLTGTSMSGWSAGWLVGILNLEWMAGKFLTRLLRREVEVCAKKKFNFFFHSLILCELLQNVLVSAIITGVYCCGPAPVKAIKNKRVDLFYDVPFVYASVNADIHTIILGQGQVLGFSKDTERVGSLICTKAVGFPRLQKITGDYKYTKSMTIKLEFC